MLRTLVWGTAEDKKEEEMLTPWEDNRRSSRRSAMRKKHVPMMSDYSQHKDFVHLYMALPPYEIERCSAVHDLGNP
jgi:hypothetical protein